MMLADKFRWFGGAIALGVLLLLVLVMADRRTRPVPPSATPSLVVDAGLRSGGRVAALSADGRLLAVATFQDEGLAITDVATGALLRRLPSLPPIAVAFAPDGETVAVVGSARDTLDWSLRLYSARTGAGRTIFETRADGSDFDYSTPAFAGIAFASRRPRVVYWRGDIWRVFDTTTGRKIASSQSPMSTRAAALSPDGARVALVDKGRLEIVALDAGETPASWALPTGWGGAESFATWDERGVLAVSRDGRVFSVDVASGRTEDAHLGPVTVIALAGRRALVDRGPGRADRLLSLDLGGASRRVLPLVEEAVGEPLSVAAIAAVNHAAFVARPDSGLLWRADGAPSARLDRRLDYFRIVDGNTLVGQTDDRLQVLTLDGGARPVVLPPGTTLGASGLLQRPVSGGTEYLDLRRRRVGWLPVGADDAVELDAQGRSALSRDPPARARAWDVATGRLLGDLSLAGADGRPGFGPRFAVLRNGRRFAAYLPYAPPATAAELPDIDGVVPAMTHANAARAHSEAAAAQVRMHGLGATGTELLVVADRTGAGLSSARRYTTDDLQHEMLSFEPEGRAFALSARYGFQVGDLCAAPNPLHVDLGGGGLTAVAWGPADAYALLGRKRGSPLVVDPLTGATAALPGPAGVVDVDVSGDGRQMLAVDSVGAVYLFDASRRRRVDTLRLPAAAARARFGRAGTLFIEQRDGALSLVHATRAKRLWRRAAGADAWLAADRSALLVADGDARLTLIDTATANARSAPAPGTGAAAVGAVAGTQAAVAIADADGTLWYAPRLGAAWRRLTQVCPRATALRFTVDGATLLMWCADARLYLVATGGESAERRTSLVGSPPPEALSRGGRAWLEGLAGNAKLWHYGTPNPVRVVGPARRGRELALSGPGPQELVPLAWSQDGGRLITGGPAGVRLWELRGGRVHGLGRTLLPGRWIDRAAFNADGDFVVAETTGVLHAYKWGSFDRPGRRFVGPAPLTGRSALHYRRDGFVMAEHRDASVRIYDTRGSASAAGYALGLVRLADNGYVAFAPGGHFDATSLERLQQVNWVRPLEPLRALPLELFTFDYFEPGLARKVIARRTLPATRDLDALNLARPRVRLALVGRPAPDLARVRVEVERGEEAFMRPDGRIVDRGEPHDVRLFRDGRLIAQWPEPAGGADLRDIAAWRRATRITIDGRGRASWTIDVPLPRCEAGEVLLTAYAFNSDRARTATTAPVAVAVRPLPSCRRRAYVVAIGVDAHRDPKLRLSFAGNDANVMTEALAASLAGRYEVVPVRLLATNTVKMATKPVIRAALARLGGRDVRAIPAAIRPLAAATPDDLVVVHFSGHGDADRSGFYLVPYGGEAKDRRSLISSDELAGWLRGVDARDIMLIVDACYSARGVQDGGFRPGPMGSRGLGQLAYDKRMRVLAASQADAVALEDPTIRHGFLTYALAVEGLRGARADTDPPYGLVSATEWLRYAEARVPELLTGTGPAVLKGWKPRYLVPVERSATVGQQPVLFDFAEEDDFVVHGRRERRGSGDEHLNAATKGGRQ